MAGLRIPIQMDKGNNKVSLNSSGYFDPCTSSYRDYDLKLRIPDIEDRVRDNIVEYQKNYGIMPTLLKLTRSEYESLCYLQGALIDTFHNIPVIIGYHGMTTPAIASEHFRQIVAEELKYTGPITPGTTGNSQGKTAQELYPKKSPPPPRLNDIRVQEEDGCSCDSLLNGCQCGFAERERNG